MIESKYYPDPTCIYNWIFKDNDSVVNNSAVKATKFGNPTFSGGVATFNGSTDYYAFKTAINLGFKYSIEIKFKLNVIADAVLIGGESTSQRILYNHSNTAIYFSHVGGTPYITWTPDTNWHTLCVARNGSTAIVLLDGVVKTITGGFSAAGILQLKSIAANYNSTTKLNGSIEYIRIWNRALTAYEVTNNYRGVTFKALPYSGTEVLGSELVVNGDFSSSAGWNFSGAGSAFTIADGVCKINNGATASLYLYRTVNKITGNLYKLTFTVTSFTSGRIIVYLGLGNGINITTAGTYTIYSNAPGDTNVYIQTIVTNTICEIDNISIKEVYQSTYNPLFHIQSYRGVIRDMLNKVTPVNTDTIPTKIGSNVKVMQFNGSTAKLDLGSQLLGTGDITCMAWINANTFGGGGYGKILRNGKIDFSLYGGINGWYFRNDDATTVSSTANAITPSKWYLLIATSTSTGIVNLYMATVNTPPVINGTANRNGGTRANGTSNAQISVSSSYKFNGQIGEVRVDNSILSLSDITQFWSDTKSLYQ